MNHPYSGAASYIYANEYPDSPIVSHAKESYANLPSFVPSPSSTSDNPWTHEEPYPPIVPPRSKNITSKMPAYIPPSSTPPVSRSSHDSSWATEGTYMRTHTGRPRAHSYGQAPLIPLRTPISHPYQQQTSVSWVEGEDDDARTAPATHVASTASHSSRVRQPSAKTTMTMTPYERDGDPLSLRRSAFVPYEPRPSERAALEAAKRERSWRRKIRVRLSTFILCNSICSSVDDESVLGAETDPKSDQAAEADDVRRFVISA
ncbi:hypothetical protein B0H10DRAFT_2078075 [Mycena sp. CBHHK59/15]|nr:hypothetical protein B0H10DRAFT_2078075 [Mycena sp. CBHHK59/15]